MLFSASVLFLAATPNPNRLIFKNVLLIMMLLHHPSLSRLVSGTFFSKDTLFSPSVCLEGTTAGCRTSNCVWLGRTGVLTHADALRCTHTNTRTLISPSTGIVQGRTDMYTQTPQMQVLRMSDPTNFYFFFCLFT